MGIPQLLTLLTSHGSELPNHTQFHTCKPLIKSAYFNSDCLLYFFFSSVLLLQECDQVHIDDVSSDDNGQDLR